VTRVLMLTGDAGEGMEIWYIIQRLKEAGIPCVVAAPSRRTLKSVVHDFEPDWDAYTEKPGYRVPVDLAFSEVRPEEFDAVVLPGGRAPEYIRDDPHVQRALRHFVDSGKLVGLMCHGTQVATAIRSVQGRRVTGYPPLKTDIENAGGVFVDAEVVIDGNFISSRGWPDLHAFMREVVAVLTAPAGARELAATR